jgi:alanine racemase
MKTSRRALLGAATASVLPRFSLWAADSSFDPWVEINTENLRHNVQVISKRVADRPILAVIKNNGYGLGVENAAKHLEPLSAIAGFAVVKLHEAVALRDAGIKKPVLLMGPFDEKNLEEAIARDIMPMVYTPVGAALDKISQKLRKPVPLHVCVDTGIGRVGVPYRAAPDLIRDLAARNRFAARRDDDVHRRSGFR